MMETSIIPKTGEVIPVIGMGTYATFQYGLDKERLKQLQQVIQLFFQMGGGMIDSSPMYGAAERVIGELLPNVTVPKNLFAATKVWTEGKQNGIDQMEESRGLWGIERFDLIQIHNLLDWRTHLDTLEGMKADGKIRYIGFTTYHGHYHSELGRILKQHDIDFVQLTYNIGYRDTAESLLDIAQEQGVAVILNEPLGCGSLFRQVRGKPLPDWAEELNCKTWGQYFLRYAVSHPAVTCAIPATTQVEHMKDNMAAGANSLPTQPERAKMQQYFESL